MTLLQIKILNKNCITVHYNVYIVGQVVASSTLTTKYHTKSVESHRE